MVLVSFVSYGQYTNMFLGENYESYNKKLTMIDVTGYNKTPSHQFWIKVPESTVDSKNILHPNKEYNFCTDIEKIKDNVYRVDSIFDFQYKSFDQKIFKLVDTKTNESIYYKYSTRNDYDYLLLTEPIVLKESDFVKEIEREVDDFTKEIKINSPYNSQVGILYKYIKKGVVTYYLSLEIGSSGIQRGSGVYILFTDGSKWSRPNEKVDITYRSGFQNNVFIRINESDLNTFKTKTIKKYRLYIHDQEVDKAEADKFKIYTSLVTKSK